MILLIENMIVLCLEIKLFGRFETSLLYFVHISASCYFYFSPFRVQFRLYFDLDSSDSSPISI